MSWIASSTARWKAAASCASFEIVGATLVSAMTRRPKAWNVNTFAALRSAGSRWRTSSAASALNASTRSSRGGTPSLRTRWATLPMITAVLPVPAPARTSVVSSSVAMASACSSVSGTRSAVRAACLHGGDSLRREALVRALAGRLERSRGLKRSEPPERFGRVRRQVSARERAVAFAHRRGQLRVQRADRGSACVAGAVEEPPRCLIDAQQLGADGRCALGCRRTGGLDDRAGRQLVQAADRVPRAVGRADAEAVPEPGAVHVDGVEGADGNLDGKRAAALDAQRPATDRRARGATLQEPIEPGAARGRSLGGPHDARLFQRSRM